MVAKHDLTFVDSDGHILEHPTAMLDYAPPEFRERIWHIDTDADGTEWLVWDGVRSPGNNASVSGTAGMSEEDCQRAMNGELRYTEVRPAAYNAKPRLDDMAADDIHMSVLYPTQLLGIQCYKDVDYAVAQCRAYNDWLSDHTQDGEGRLFGAALLPQQDIEAAAAELRRAAKLPGHGRGVHPAQPHRRLEAIQPSGLQPHLGSRLRHRLSPRPASVPRLPPPGSVHRHAFRPGPRGGAPGLFQLRTSRAASPSTTSTSARPCQTRST